jgi:hypothetical protein
VPPAVRERAKLAKAKAKRLSKATDKAYFVRRLRARAGTVVAPGPRFVSPVPAEARSIHFTGELGHRDSTFTTGRHRVRLAVYRAGCGFTAADAVQVPALRGGATGACRELALRVDPRNHLS